VAKQPAPPTYFNNDAGGNPLAGVGPGVGFEFAKIYFKETQHILRIATAYFSLRGFDLCREFIKKDVQLHFLVGKRDGFIVQETVRQEIRKELYRGDSGDLFEAVTDLVNRIKSQRFQIRNAREMQRPFHCKVYISDNQFLWHGSANFSKNGLLLQAEQVTFSKNAAQLCTWIGWFDEVAANAKDLISEVLEDLEKWLKMATPYEVYLKSLYLIFGLTEASFKKGAMIPVYFQNALIAWALQQLNNSSGAIMVVGTGLGKTIIGAEVAGRLFRQREINEVILFAPQNVHREWRKQLKSARGVPVSVYDNSILFRKASLGRSNKINELLEELENADEHTLVIVDEAHRYRNQLLNRETGQVCLALDRLSKAAKQNVKLLGLTGSAYSTNIQNLNSLLEMLPSKNEEQEKQQVKSIQEFMDLSSVCVLGIPHVLKMAKERQDLDEQGNLFIPFENGKKYLPRILRSRKVSYTPPLLSQMLNAFHANCFRQYKKIKSKAFDDEKGIIDAISDSAQQFTLRSWLSSPGALQIVLEKNLVSEGISNQLNLNYSGQTISVPESYQGELWVLPPISPPGAKTKSGKTQPLAGFKAPLKVGQAIRESLLRPILLSFQGSGFKDHKLDKLIAILHERCVIAKASAIIFVDFYLTAVYLERYLKKGFRKKIRIASTVKPDGLGLKRSAMRRDIITKFSPMANDSKLPAEFDVLICTDADGVGVNMQDADTIINYDLSGGADVLVQRLGRILRPSGRAEKVPHVYTFEPDFTSAENPLSPILTVIGRWKSFLKKRHDKSSIILSASILGVQPDELLELDGEVNLDKLTEGLSESFRSGKQISVAQQISIYAANREEAEGLPEGIFSAKFYNKKTPRLVVLFKYKDQVNTVIYNTQSEKIESTEDLAALKLLYCNPKEFRAPVKTSIIKRTANDALRCWGKITGVDPALTEWIVMLYLLPKDSDPKLFNFVGRGK
jgi:superfamily II DNA or RNA helicase